ncbi:Conserved hypothetical protein [Bifidobacterium breve UCC2003]|nr:Conserved hypothetical protein [Bifidobacterium breve UCC2003]
MDHSGRTGNRHQLDTDRTVSVHHHYRYSTRSSGVQNGGPYLDTVRQNRAIRWRRWLHAGQYPLGGAGRLVDGTRLSGCRRAQLHHHHRHSVRHPVVQNGQACALAVRRTDLQSVTIVSAVGPVQRIIIVRCTGLFIYNGHFTHRVI